MRRVRHRASKNGRFDLPCRILDFLCCSLSPKLILRRISCGPESFALWVRVNDPSHYDLVSGNYEAVVLDWLHGNLNSGETFWDVGANVGFYAIIGAKLVGPAGKVVAVEADPDTAKILAANFETNHLTNARVVSAALTDTIGTVRFGRAPATGWSGIYYENSQEWVNVEALTGDALMKSLSLDEVHAIKIDVEGSEAHVLRGMSEILTRAKSRLLVEVHRTHAGVEEEVAAILVNGKFECDVLDQADATMHLSATARHNSNTEQCRTA
jgi:FkbM family methyltransferase